MDYEPIDISAAYNAASDILGSSQPAPNGRMTLRGLPFLVGTDEASPADKVFIALDGASGGVKIPIGKTARNVIIAHSLLQTDLLEGGIPGKPVAEYVFRLSNGREKRVPIRERFEIGMMFQGNELSQRMARMSGVPFIALGNQDDFVLPRYEGRWSETGRRQTESGVGTPSAFGFYLWAWKNPNPDQSIESLEIVPKGPRFLLVAVTLGNVDEHPFVRQGRRETRIVLNDSKHSGKPFDLDVEVDRGIATYAYPLPEASPEDFMNDPLKGFGESLNPKSSPTYVEIAAIPSATVTVKQNGNEVDKVRWGDVEEKGLVDTPKMRVELLDRGRNWVNVTVLDDETGRPVPCRVHFRSPEGIPYQPHGHHDHVNSNMETWHIDVGGDLRLGQITYAYINGTCQGWLPRGEVIVDVARGYEYEPLRTKVKIEPGQQELTLRIKRWINMNSKRWFSGDSHVHFLSTQGSHTESQGEDLNVVNLLQSQWGSLFTETEEFTGRPSVLQDGNNIVYVSQENRQHFMGHMILWGLKKPVMPWCSDGPGEAEIGGTMETTLSHWADECHSQGGKVILPHFPMPNGEPAALIATHRVDGVEMIRQAEYHHIEYYRYLNCGYRLPLIGGTDKMSNEVPVGMYRTYAYMPDDLEFNYDNWCKSVSEGRTFLSGGPIIHFSVEGQNIGDTVQLSGAGTVEVEAWAESIFPIHRLEIVQQGRVVASSEDLKGTRRLSLKTKLKVDGHTWLAARCGGPNYYNYIPHHDIWSRGIFAHTSPIYVACGGEWSMFDEGAAKYMLTLIEGSLTYVREVAPMRQAGSVTHHHGEDDHQAYLERPLLEAQAAIHQRMHQLGLAH